MPEKTTPRFILLILFLLSSVIILIAYNDVSKYWTSIGATKSQHYRFEVPFALALLSLLYFPNAKNNFTKFVFPAIPIIILYVLFDIFYTFLATSPRLSDFQNIHTLFDFSYSLAYGTLLLATIIPLSMYFTIHNAYDNNSIRAFKYSLLLRILALLVFILLLNTSFFSNWHNKKFIYTEWSQEKTIKKNGRFSSFIFYGNKEKENKSILLEYNEKGTDIQKTLYPKTIEKKRNVHMIVLESFIDPRLLNEPKLSKDPLHPDIKPYLKNNEGNFTQVISSVYGGGTAQPEFELLTGIKALKKVSSIEFNIMKGNPISSFVDRLEQNNYRTTATIATAPRFYNSIHAYNSLGFNKVTFLTEKESGYKKNKNDNRIFDGDLLGYNIIKVKEMLTTSNKPIFNYVLGMYGHLPYKRNLPERPDVVKSKHSDKKIHRISNQFYYRTQALAQYIKELLAIDPNSIIYITSDHLPPILGKKIHYKKNKLINISLFLDNGKHIDTPLKHHYEIPWLIWDMLRGEKSERTIDNQKMEKLYFKALSESI